jgi:hypothetical protein
MPDIANWPVNMSRGQDKSRRTLPTGRGANPNVRETSFKLLPGGSLIELIRQSDRDELQFLKWPRNHKFQIQPNLQIDGLLLKPPELETGLSRSIRFPTGVADYGSVWDLFTDVAAAIAKYISVPDDQIYLIAAYAMATWLTDRFGHAPYLSIIGPLASGKTQLLQVLNCCCRRPFLVSDISGAGVYTLTHRLQLTLLIDEAEFGRDYRSGELRRLLRAGHTAGGSIFRARRAYCLYGPKVLCSREPIPDTALASRCLHVAMPRAKCDLAPLDPAVLDSISDRLQPKLLMFRLRNYLRRLDVKADLSMLSPRSRDLAAALAGPLVDHPKLQMRLVDLILQQEADVHARHSDEPELLVLEALFLRCHSDPRFFTTVGDVAAGLNKLLESRGERRKFEPRAVGPILRQLGFATSRIGSAGIGIEWNKKTLFHVHDQMERYAIPLEEFTLPTQGCTLCTFFLEKKQCS